MAVDLRAPETYQAILSSSTPTDTLKAIGEALIAEKDKSERDKFADAPFLWRLLALNPSLPSSLAEEAAKKSPGDFLINPSFPILALINPAIGDPKPDMVAQSIAPFNSSLVLLKHAIHGNSPDGASYNALGGAFDLAVRLREGPAMYHLGQAIYETSRGKPAQIDGMRSMVRGLIDTWPLECLPLLYAMLDVPDGYVPQPAPAALDVARASLTLDAPPPADPRLTDDMAICLPHGHPWHAVAKDRTHYAVDDHWEFVDAARGFVVRPHTAERIAAGVRRNDAFAVCIALMVLDLDAQKPMWRRMHLSQREILWEAIEPFLDPNEQPGFVGGPHARRKAMKHARAWPAVENWLNSDVTTYSIPNEVRPPPPEIMDLPNSVLRDWCALSEWPWGGHGERQFDRTHIKAKAILWMQALAAREPHYRTDAAMALDALIREFGLTTDTAAQVAHYVPETIPAMVEGMMATATEAE